MNRAWGNATWMVTNPPGMGLNPVYEPGVGKPDPVLQQQRQHHGLNPVYEPGVGKRKRMFVV